MVSGKENSIFIAFGLVKTLSRSNGTEFLSYLDPKKRGGKAVSLFMEIKKVDDFHLLSYEEGDRKGLLNSCYLLIEKGVEFLAAKSNSKDKGIERIDVSMRFGAFKNAKKLLRNELIYSLRNNDMGRLWELYRREETLRNQYGIEIKFREGVPTFQEFLLEFSLMNKALILRFEIAAVVQKKLEDRQKHFDKVSDQISELVYDYQISLPQLEALGTIRTWYIEGQDYDNVLLYQEKIISLLDRNPGLISNDGIIREELKYVGFLTIKGHFSHGYKLLKRIKTCIDRNPFTHSSLVVKWLTYSIVCHAHSPLMRMEERADYIEGLLVDNSNLIPKGQKGAIFHAMSLVFGYEEDWDKVIYWQRKVSGCTELQGEGFRWAHYAVKCIAYLEKSDLENAGNQLDRMYATIKEKPNDFALLTYSILEDIISFPSLDSIPGDDLSRYRVDLKQSATKIENLTQADYLNISIWLKSIEMDKALSELMKSGNEIGFFHSVS